MDLWVNRLNTHLPWNWQLANMYCNFLEGWNLKGGESLLVLVIGRLCHPIASTKTTCITRLMLPEEIVLNTTHHVYAAEQWYLRSLIHHFSFPPCEFARWLCSWAGCLCLSYEVCMNLTRRCLEEATNDHFNHWLQQRSTVESQLRRCRRRVVWCKVWRWTEADRLTKQSPFFLEGGGQGIVKIYWLTTRLQVWLFGKIYGENLQEFYGSWCHSRLSV